MDLIQSRRLAQLDISKYRLWLDLGIVPRGAKNMNPDSWIIQRMYANKQEVADIYYNAWKEQKCPGSHS